MGSYPEVTLASAREPRDNASKLLASEPPVDPSESRHNEKAEKLANKSNTFELWAKKWWRFTLQILSTLAIDHPASALHIRD